MAPNSRQYDVVLLGCGFYGRLVLQRLLELLPGGQCRVGIAGRSAERLESNLAMLGLDEEQVGVVAPVDASDYMAMKTLAAETRIILACLSNYRVVGDAVVRACAEEGTHYFDLSVETSMHREWRALYGDAAAGSGCIIAPSCGLAYVVADFGALEMARLFPPPTRLHTIECYITVKVGPTGIVLREQTFLDLLDRMGRPSPTSQGGQLQRSPGASEANSTSLLDRILGAVPLQYNWDLGVFSLPGPQSGVDVVDSSNDQIRMEENTKEPPRRFVNRVVVPSVSLALMYVFGLTVMLLAKLAWLRWALALVAPPFLRQLGVLTHDEARYQEAMRNMSVQMVLVGKGYRKGSDSRTNTITSGSPLSPASDSTIARTLTITAPGLVVTPMALALAAHTVLTEREKIRPRGFTTPAAAFHSTLYWRRLKDWSKLSITEGTEAATNGQSKYKGE